DVGAGKKVLASGRRNRQKGQELLTFLDIANVLLPLAYLLVAVDYGVVFFAPQPLARRMATPALGGVVLLHLADLVVLTVQWRQFPAATESQALSMVAFAVAAIYLYLEWHGRERSTGFWLVALVFFFQLLSSLLARPNPPDRAIFHDPLFAAHVTLALMGYASFVLAAGYAFLFLQLYRELKAGRFSTFYGKLPPLATLERMMTAALTVGFISLTAAVLAGGLWAERLYHSGWLHDPKIVFTLITWALYAVALVLRRLRRWQGRQTALASLAGLASILFSLVAVNLFFTGFHGFL
ncbi:MAG: cytochrome c biogenesis protein CcsA, partial [Acidobacteriota bacterium]|nr:cytochrome c biogenesis protein CcsA [Acidobacteriota bacterium]